MVRECKAVVEEELSGWNQVEKQVYKMNQGDCKKPKLELESGP